MRRFIVTIKIFNYTMDDAMSAKEALAQCLEGLGDVWVTDVREESPKQIRFVDGEYRYE